MSPLTIFFVFFFPIWKNKVEIRTRTKTFHDRLTQAVQAHNVRSYLYFYFYANDQRNVTKWWHVRIYYYITTELTPSPCSVWRCCGFRKVCMGAQRFYLKRQLFLYFLNKIYLPYLLNKRRTWDGKVNKRRPRISTPAEVQRLFEYYLLC